MQIPRPVGRGAGVRKYDLLTALTAFGLSGTPMQQRRVLRLTALITARYNWQRDELSIGQTEIARLWSVDARTVKREMAWFRSVGWLRLKRQGARGRVSLYGLGLDAIRDDTARIWPNIGPDFVARNTPDALSPGNVVPLRPVPAPEAAGAGWGGAKAVLHAADPATYGAWFASLVEAGIGEGCLTLAAPTRFHAAYVRQNLGERLLAAVRQTDPTVVRVEIVH
ncbi:hypothetical protein DXV76_20435 [Rhodobacteraceae bacterium CCMM004]|nr:hypothetical protein DXV76_20435 [Rhodobacteraceae bacterium CCMM004]